jgi:hypothetical protein
MRRIVSSTVLAGLWAVMPIIATMASEPTKDQEEQRQVEATLTLTRECAEQYEFANASGIPLHWESRPILRWSNPERGQVYGNVFVWTLDGRPQTVGSLFKWYSPHTHMSHEFQSLSTEAIAARYQRKDVWKSSGPGVQMKTLPGGPSVADAAPARLLQMRQAAKRFTARSTTREGQQQELRLLPQPVYRYDVAKDAPIVDGGLFVFVEGTDPELWLLIEARRNNDKSPDEWTYGLARMNSIALAARLDGTEIWHQDVLPWAAISAHHETYTSFQFKNP